MLEITARLQVDECEVKYVFSSGGSVVIVTVSDYCISIHNSIQGSIMLSGMEAVFPMTFLMESLIELESASLGLRKQSTVSSPGSPGLTETP
jgi:hypothetical protein